MISDALRHLVVLTYKAEQEDVTPESPITRVFTELRITNDELRMNPNAAVLDPIRNLRTMISDALRHLVVLTYKAEQEDVNPESPVTRVFTELRVTNYELRMNPNAVMFDLIRNSSFVIRKL